MNINHLDAFSDNYIWILESEGKVAVVDPGDAKPVHDYIEKTGFSISEVLITHHHWDHTGGLEEVVSDYGCLAYGPSGGHIKGITNPLTDNEIFSVLGNFEFTAFQHLVTPMINYHISAIQLKNQFFFLAIPYFTEVAVDCLKERPRICFFQWIGIKNSPQTHLFIVDMNIQNLI